MNTAPRAMDMAGGNGLIVFSEITEALYSLVAETARHGRARVLTVAVGVESADSAAIWSLLRAGAADVVAWERSHNPAAEIAARFEHWVDVDRALASPLVQNNLIGSSPAWIAVLRQVIEMAQFPGASVLICGESGTGKELIARLTHTLDPRPDKGDLIVLDCTTVMPELAGSEFFGHERGAYTGSAGPREGAFALADGGTLFLDEVGELPLFLQAQLLRVVQEKAYKRVGGNQWDQTNFRLVCATNRNLMEEQERGQFRRGFYYRIATCTCTVPPLRQRPEDILPLARYFLKKLRPDISLDLEEAVTAYLLLREYPGNVRDLLQLVARMACRHAGAGPLTVGDIPEDKRPSGGAQQNWRDAGFEDAVLRAVISGAGLKAVGRAAEETAERLALEVEKYNVQRTANLFGITDSSPG